MTISLVDFINQPCCRLWSMVELDSSPLNVPLRQINCINHFTRLSPHIGGYSLPLIFGFVPPIVRGNLKLRFDPTPALSSRPCAPARCLSKTGQINSTLIGYHSFCSRGIDPVSASVEVSFIAALAKRF